MATAEHQYESFYAARKYYDDENFPYGFDRSGEFTPSQVRILTDHGFALQQLTSGTREPVTEEERSFLAFCRGEHPSETPVEKTWERYCKICQKDKHFYTVGDSRSPSSNTPVDSYDDDFDD